MRRPSALPLLLLASCYGPEPFGWETPVDRVPFEYVVGLADEATELDLDELAASQGLEVLEYRPEDRIAVLGDDGGRTEEEVLPALDVPGLTSFAEPQFLYHPSFQPNDWGEYLWGLRNSGIGQGRPGADIAAFGAWDVARGAGVVVAVIDTGLDVSHPDLRDNLWRNAAEVAGNGVDDDGNGYVDDLHGFDFVRRRGNPVDVDGHGTHVAGTVAARGHNGEGVVGVAFETKVMGIKFMEGNSGGTSSQAAEAIRYAVRSGAKVINASWGGPGGSTAIRNAISWARSQGVLFVTAAGNEGSDNDRFASYPANYDLDNIISVAASDRSDRLAEFSNFGRTRVDLAAPGVEIASTLAGGDYGYMDGTSMASPHVAGAAAILLSARPSTGYLALRAALLGGAEPLRSGADRIVTGGRLDLEGSLAELGVAVGSGAVEDPDAPGGGEEGGTGGTPPDSSAPTGPFTFVPFPVESPHPYSDDFSGRVGIEAPEGASQVVLHFDRLEVETNYDFVRAITADGTVLAAWTGTHGAIDSAVLPARHFDLFLQTDGSITGWGLKLRGFSYR